MATVIRTNLATVLLAIQAWLMTKLTLPAERCLIIAFDEFPFDAHGDQMLAIRPLEEYQPNEDEAGRVDHRSLCPFLVYLKTRVALDEANNSVIALTDASLGHLKWRRDIKDALQEFHAVDSQDNWLTVMPMRWRGSSKPDRPSIKTEWIQSASQFELVYEDDFDQSYQ